MNEMMKRKVSFFPVFKSKLTLFILIVVVAIVGIGVYKYSQPAASKGTNEIRRTITVEKGEVSEKVAASGTVQAAKHITMNFPESDERIDSTQVKVGQQVKKGQILATMNPTSADMEWKIATANLQAAKASVAEKQQAKGADEITVLEGNLAKATAGLDSAKKKYEIEKAQMQQDKSAKALQDAKTNYERHQKLFEAGAISKSELEKEKNNLDQASTDYRAAQMQYDQSKDQSSTDLIQAQAAYDAAVAQLNQAKSPADESVIQSAIAAVAQAEVKVQEAQMKKERFTLKAPIDGIILEVNGSVGENAVEPFLVMDNSQADELEVMAKISQNDITKVKEGMNATFTIGTYSDKEFHGTVKVVHPEGTTEQGVTTYKVLLSVDNKERLLKSGMNLNVSISIGSNEAVVYVPTAALRNQGGKTGVLLKDKDGKAATGANNPYQGYHFQEVTTGLVSSDRTEILSGLKEGDQILLTSSKDPAPAAPTRVQPMRTIRIGG